MTSANGCFFERELGKVSVNVSKVCITGTYSTSEGFQGRAMADIAALFVGTEGRNDDGMSWGRSEVSLVTWVEWLSDYARVGPSAQAQMGRTRGRRPMLPLVRRDRAHESALWIGHLKQTRSGHARCHQMERSRSRDSVCDRGSSIAESAVRMPAICCWAT